LNGFFIGQTLLGRHKLLKGVLILLSFQLAGEFISSLLALPFPGAVIGMALLFLFLLIKGSTPLPLSTTSSALFPYIPLFLMPACVGAMSYWALLKDEWIALSIALTVSIVIAFFLIPVFMRGSLLLFGTHKQSPSMQGSTDDE